MQARQYLPQDMVTSMLKDNILRLFVFIYAAFNLLYYFLPLDFLFHISTGILIYILVSSMIELPNSSRAAIGGLFSCSAILMISSGATWEQWITGLGKNGLLVAMFTFAPLLHLPFSFDDYQQELKNVAKAHMHTLVPFNFLIALATHMFAALTGFAAFAIMYHLFLHISRLYDAEDIFISTLGRSYATSGFWGTSWVSVALVVSELHIPWYRLIAVGTIFTLVSIVIILLSIKLKMIRNPRRFPTLTPDKDATVDWRRVWIMIGLSISIVAAILILSLISGWSLLAIVSLVGLIFPVLIALIQKKGKEYRQGTKDYASKFLIKARVNTCIFSTAGLLAYALEISKVGEKIPGLIPSAFMGVPYMLVLTLMLLIIIPGQFGIHPVATGTTLVAVIVPSMLGLTVPEFALAIICAWLLSNMLSPFSALNLTLSGLSDRSTWQTGLKLNWAYGLTCLLVYSILIFVLAPFLGNPVN